MSFSRMMRYSIAFDGDFCSGILAIKNTVADFNGHRLIFFAGANSHHFTFLWFFFSGIGNDNSTCGFFFGGIGLNDTRSANGFKATFAMFIYSLGFELNSFF